MTLFGTYISFQFLVTQYLQTLSGWSAMSTALAFLPAGVMVVVLSTRMGSLLGRFGPTPLTALAFSCLVIAYAVFLRAGVRPDYPAVMLPATLLVGLAFGLGFSSLSVAATAGVPDAEQGLAASLFQTSFQVGGAVVLAVVTAVVEAGGAGRVASASATLAAYRPALVLITGIAAIGALVALSGLRSPRALPGARGGRARRRGPDVAARDVAGGAVASTGAAAGRAGRLPGAPAGRRRCPGGTRGLSPLVDRSAAGSAVSRDDDHHGRSALARAVRAAAACGPRPSGRG